MVLDKRSILIIVDKNMLNVARHPFDQNKSIKVVKIRHEICAIKISPKEIKEINFIELLIIAPIEELNNFFKYLKRSKHLLFNESSNLISQVYAK